MTESSEVHNRIFGDDDNDDDDDDENFMRTLVSKTYSLGIIHHTN